MDEEAGGVIVLLDTDGQVLAATDAWLGAFDRQRLPAPGGDEDYASALGRLCPDLDADGLREGIAALAARRTEEVTATAVGDGGLGPLQVRIQRLGEGPGALLVATSSDMVEMAQALAALPALEDQLALARSAERGRFAQSLAELTAPHLEALRGNLARLREAADDQQTADTVAYMEGSLREAILETRNLAALLHPAALDDGLAMASRRLAHDFAAGAGVRLRYRASGEVDAAPRPVQEAAFRVIQEALSNVYRHAAASSVSVTVAARDAALHVRVADDGRGLTPGELALGVGIPGMQARAADLGGAVEVIARKGVIVLAYLPYEAAASGP